MLHLLDKSSIIKGVLRWFRCAKLLIHPVKLSTKTRCFQVICYGAMSIQDIGERRTTNVKHKSESQIKSVRSQNS
mgnify:CR=1 FL=1